jgi:uncharacterized protein (DUF305 family)
MKRWLFVSAVSLPVLATTLAYGQQAASSVTMVQPGAPGQSSKVITPAAATAMAPKISAADVKFMQDMIMHHAQAVEMTALIGARSRNAEVEALGKKISLSQSSEILFMKNWLRLRGKEVPMDMTSMPGMDMGDMDMPLMPGMLTPKQMEALRKATGAEFDHLFLTGMIQHHTGALTMVNGLFSTAGAGQDADLFDFATDVDNTQRAEIRIMENLLKEKR